MSQALTTNDEGPKIKKREAKKGRMKIMLFLPEYSL